MLPPALPPEHPGLPPRAASGGLRDGQTAAQERLSTLDSDPERPALPSPGSPERPPWQHYGGWTTGRDSPRRENLTGSHVVIVGPVTFPDGSTGSPLWPGVVTTRGDIPDWTDQLETIG